MNDLNSSQHQIFVADKPFQKAFFFKYFAGKYWYITAWLIPFLICFLIPWEYLYHQAWYQAYIEFAASFLPVLTNIESSDILFKEYAIAFLAFIDVVGLGLSTFVLVYGFVAVKISGQHRMISWTLKSLIFKYLPILLLITFGVIYWSMHWDITVPDKFPQITLLRKDAFIATAILLWWSTIISFFVVPIFLKVFCIKFKSR